MTRRLPVYLCQVFLWPASWLPPYPIAWLLAANPDFITTLFACSPVGMGILLACTYLPVYLLQKPDRKTPFLSTGNPCWDFTCNILVNPAGTILKTLWLTLAETVLITLWLTPARILPLASWLPATRTLLLNLWLTPAGTCKTVGNPCQDSTCDSYSSVYFLKSQKCCKKR